MKRHTYGEVNDYKYRLVKVNWNRSKVIWWWLPIVWRWIPRFKYPTMYLSDDQYDKDHEEGHVLQWYDYGRWGFIRKWITKWGRLNFEAECTARKVLAQVNATGADPIGLIQYYADIYPKAYHLRGYSTAQCADIINKYYHRLVEHG